MKQHENWSEMLTKHANFPYLSAADECTHGSKSARGETESMMRAVSKAVRRDGLTSTTLAQIDLRYAVANDDRPFADVVPGHLAARRMQRHITASLAVLAGLILLATLLHGYNTMRPMPDLVTFAARV